MRDRVRVMLSGMGLISSLGNTVGEMFDALVRNESAVKVFPEWRQYKGLNSYVAAPAKPYDEKAIPRTARRSMSRMSEMATLATHQALNQAGLAPLKGSPRTLLILGSTTGGPEAMEMYFRKLFERGGPEGQLSTAFFKVM